MDSMVIVGGIVLLVLLGPWVLVWRVNVSRKREREEDQGQRRELASRVSALEHTVQNLQAQRPSPAAKEATPKASDRSTVVQYTPQSSSPSIVSPPPTAPVVEPTASVQVAEDWVRQRVAESATTADSSSLDRAVPSVQAPVTPPSQASFTSTEPVRSLADQFKSAHDVEEMLGTNWLNKLGIVILVLGVAFFLAYQLKTLGPAGKVLVGFLTSGVMLGAGIWFDRKERYRILARAGIGGGWALLFFTTYAMYHVPAAHLL
jgi:uncharacterized membrane protein